jgi:hypothetical protein
LRGSLGCWPRWWSHTTGAVFPPALLIPRVQARLRNLRRLHTGRVNLAQRRQLLVAGGWLATLLATLQFDAGDQPAAEDSRDAALQLGKAAGHQEIMAWSFELLAWFALVNHHLARPSTWPSRA